VCTDPYDDHVFLLVTPTAVHQPHEVAKDNVPIQEDLLLIAAQPMRSNASRRAAANNVVGISLLLKKLCLAQLHCLHSLLRDRKAL
jgi:hypothetical protein